MVQVIPLETTPAEELQTGGFIGLMHDKLGDIHCFQPVGVELRELRLTGFKPLTGTDDKTHKVMYRGPLAQVMDERGQIFRRGERTDVCAATWTLFRQQPFHEEFTCFHSSQQVNTDEDLRP